MDRKQIIRDLFDCIEENNLEKFVSIIDFDSGYLDENTPFGTWLHIASSEGRLDFVKKLIGFGLDANKRGGTFNGSAINEAASRGRYDIVRYLLSIGAELDTSEPERNPLFGAIMCGSKEIVQLLLDSGIDASVRYTGQYMNNMDAYDFAIERGQKEIAEMLKPYRK